MKKEPLYEFAFSKEDQRVVHISEISDTMKGFKCNCVCSCCGAKMMAKIGKKRRRHFSHSCNENCTANHSNETSLHLIAKEIFEESSYINLPAFYLKGSQDPNCNTKDKRQEEKYKCFDEYCFKYNSVLIEKRDGDIIPDIVLCNDKERLNIEIAVTHKVDVNKSEKLRNKGLSCVEIDIACLITKFDREALKNLLVESVEKKKWITHKNERDYLNELKYRNEGLEKEFIKKEVNIIQADKNSESVSICDTTRIKHTNINKAERIIDSLEDVVKYIDEDIIIRKSNEKRWVKCRECSIIEDEDDFVQYGPGNIGLCRKCQRKDKNF